MISEAGTWFHQSLGNEFVVFLMSVWCEDVVPCRLLFLSLSFGTSFGDLPTRRKYIGVHLFNSFVIYAGFLCERSQPHFV